MKTYGGNKLGNIIKSIKPSKKELISAIPETIAISSMYFPLNVFLETNVSGLDNLTSIITRSVGFFTTFLLMPYIMRGRKKTKELTNTKINSHPIRKFASDTLFALSLGITTKAGLYSLSGLISPEPFDYYHLGIATGTVAILATATSGLGFYVMDVFKEMTGFKEYERTPKWLQNSSTITKKTIATGFVTASLLFGGYIYSSNNKYKINNYYNKTTEENVINSCNDKNYKSKTSDGTIDDLIYTNYNQTNFFNKNIHRNFFVDPR